MSHEDAPLHARRFTIPISSAFLTPPIHPNCPSVPKQVAASRPLEDLDGNVEKDATGPGVQAKNNRLKRKLSSPVDESKGRFIARRLDFTK